MTAPTSQRHDIKTIAVIGSGVMGSGIAAQIANAGFNVYLYDIVDDQSDNRSAIASSAVEKMHKTAPAPLMLPSFSKRITPKNLSDDLGDLAHCDWIIEVVVEQLDIKHDIYKKIDAHRKKGSIISSNTSTIPLEKLTQGFDASFKEDFLITHFFNPPRYLRLLELVTSDQTNKGAIQRIEAFCDIHLGKGIVPCNDRPGFIANRIGTFWMQTGLNTAIAQNTPIDIADTVMSKPMGIPKTALFGLIDLVGVDLLPKLGKSLCENLPKSDEFQNIAHTPDVITQMIEQGYTGRKGKGGFSRMLKGEDGARQLMVLDIHDALTNGFSAEKSYIPAQKHDLDSLKNAKAGMRAVLESKDAGGRFAKEVMVRTLGYTATLIPEIADDIIAVDTAMKLGYNWAYGPFEMIDMVGADWLVNELDQLNLPSAPLLKSASEKGGFYKTDQNQKTYLSTDGAYQAIPVKEGILRLSTIKAQSNAIYESESAALWDIGEDIICLEFTGKMNAIDHGVFSAVHKAVEIIGDTSTPYKALVLYNEHSFFSAGANLKLALDAMEAHQGDVIPELVSEGQKAMTALKFAPFPVVAAPTGLALGGGCEFLLHSDHVQAHAELYCGLVEVGVGLIPGWGGCKEMILRYQAAQESQQEGLCFDPSNDPMAPILNAFDLITNAKTARSAHDAKRLGYLKPSDGITMNIDRLLFDARTSAINLAKDYTQSSMIKDIRLPGQDGFKQMTDILNQHHHNGVALDYDMVVGTSVATVLSGGGVPPWEPSSTEQDLLDLEYKEFVKLVKNDGTKDRIAHMLKTGKPLRN